MRRRERTKVLDDVVVREVLEQFDLGLERGDHALDSEVLLVAHRAWELDLLHGDRFSGRHVEGDVNFAVRSTTDELSLDPLDRKSVV